MSEISQINADLLARIAQNPSASQDLIAAFKGAHNDEQMMFLLAAARFKTFPTNRVFWEQAYRHVNVSAADAASKEQLWEANLTDAARRDIIDKVNDLPQGHHPQDANILNTAFEEVLAMFRNNLPSSPMGLIWRAFSDPRGY